jgi:predicted RNase H-like HicB family nuclease
VNSPQKKVFIYLCGKIIAMKNFKFTAIIEKGENGWYVGQVEEVPEAISQGKTIAELKENLIDALRLILDLKRESLI